MTFDLGRITGRGAAEDQGNGSPEKIRWPISMKQKGVLILVVCAGASCERPVKSGPSFNFNDAVYQHVMGAGKAADQAIPSRG
jgi:hypothetical protein